MQQDTLQGMRTQDEPRDDEAGAVGLPLVQEVKAGGQHDAAGDRVGQRRELLAQRPKEEEGHRAQAAGAGHGHRQEEHRGGGDRLDVAAQRGHARRPCWPLLGGRAGCSRAGRGGPARTCSTSEGAPVRAQLRRAYPDAVLDVRVGRGAALVQACLAQGVLLQGLLVRRVWHRVPAGHLSEARRVLAVSCVHLSRLPKRSLQHAFGWTPEHSRQAHERQAAVHSPPAERLPIAGRPSSPCAGLLLS